MKEKQHVNIQIDHSEGGFYCDSISVVYNPSKFVLDFRQTTPRIDQIHGKNQQTLAVKHKVILLDVKFAKVFLNTLKSAVQGYEKKYGEIKLPKAKKTKKKAEIVDAKDEEYIG
ncbi:MAG: DUF3467 domain-containing protein [Candidatus Aenigmarchaeota archaeon]|nr:DUF3467 domain-containing protein [Candidatus Aenigmarchaeota archaeon]